MNDLLKRIDYSPSLSECAIEILLLDCRAEIQRLLLANETLKELNVEYLERVKALEAKPNVDELIAEIDEWGYRLIGVRGPEIKEIVDKWRTK